jgi:hypothetical protein
MASARGEKVLDKAEVRSYPTASMRGLKGGIISMPAKKKAAKKKASKKKK